MGQTVLALALTFLTTVPLFAQGVERPVIAFASDTQAPMWIETIFLRSNQNKSATGMIFNDIAKQKPLALFILGDVVSKGYRERKWVNIDRYLKLCRDSGIYVTALLGNHDVMTNAKKGELLFQKRFTDHTRTGFVKVIDSIAIVLLNSNFSKLGDGPMTLQERWLKATLDTLDHNPSVYATIVACHHAPFTNSRIVGSNTDVQERFVPPFLQSVKCRLFLTGHSHNFESFMHNGKQFLIIGGGGGLHQPLRKESDRMEDLYADYKPMFHYLHVQRTKEGLFVSSRFLKPDFSGFDMGKSFVVKY